MQRNEGAGGGGGRGGGLTRVHPEREHRAGGTRILESSYPGGLRLDRHRHDRASLTLVLAGTLEERTEHGTHRAGPGSVVLKPPGTEHANRFGPSGARTLLLDVGDFVGASASPPVRRWQWTDGGPPARAMLRVLEALRLWPEELEPVVDEVLSEMPALLEAEPGRDPASPPGWVRDARRRLEASPRDPPRVRELAEDADVHPTHLTRRFKRAYGLTVTAHVRRLRTREAARLIADGRPLGRVAMEAGFADQSHLCRVFKRETGLTPGRFRDLI